MQHLEAGIFLFAVVERLYIKNISHPIIMFVIKQIFFFMLMRFVIAVVITVSLLQWFMCSDDVARFQQDYLHEQLQQLQQRQNQQRSLPSSLSSSIDPIRNSKIITINSLRHSEHSHLSLHQQSQQGSQEEEYQCRWYIAESAIPNGGLGVFTANGLHPNDMIGFPDICIFVSDPPKRGTSHLRSHTFGIRKFFGQYESIDGRTNRAACEGFTTIYNTVPTHMVNTELVSPIIATNAGLHRSKSPGAGSITHHYGIHGVAKDVIQAGSELTINYHDWNFNKDHSSYNKKPFREVDWLKQHGWCVDYIDISSSTIPNAGRGAFSKTTLNSGDVISPVPLQIFPNRNVFDITTSIPNDRSQFQKQQLILNYCLQFQDSDIIVYPYGPGVNLINHNHITPNVAFRWSNHPNNTLHHKSWLDLSLNELWDHQVKPGHLLLEVVALRTILPNEELLLDYGINWENAWQKHINNWKPVHDANEYMYPTEIDETQPIRTIYEQKNLPYPDNLITMCRASNSNRKYNKTSTWLESESSTNKWWRGLTYCHILERKYDNGHDLYTVSLIFNWSDHNMISNYNMNNITDTITKSLNNNNTYLDYKVPRRAIRFIEKPYYDDEHLFNTFRHPIDLPIELTPLSWRKK